VVTRLMTSELDLCICLVPKTTLVSHMPRTITITNIHLELHRDQIHKNSCTL